MEWTTFRLLLALSAAPYLSVPVKGMYNLQVLVTSFSNPLNATAEYVCCRQTSDSGEGSDILVCPRPCDIVFLFCLRPLGFDMNSDECPLGSYSNGAFSVSSSGEVFSAGSLLRNIGNVPNPMLFTGDSNWLGSFQLRICVDQLYDDGSTALIDRLVTNQRSLNTSNTFTNIHALSGDFLNVMMYVRFLASCQQHYYGPDCSVYEFCLAMDNENGHYICSDLDGSKICLSGYMDPLTNCTTPFQIVTRTCPAETVDGVSYGVTPLGVSVVAECPQLASETLTVLGFTNRTCFRNGTWSAVNTSRCTREDFQTISQMAESTFGQSTLADVEPQEVLDIIEALSQATSPATLQEGAVHFVQDLNISVQVVNMTIDYLHFNLDADDTPLDFNEEIFEVINNVLNTSDVESWDDLQLTDGGSEILLQSAEFYGQYVAQAIMSDRVDTGDANEKTLDRSNIVLNVAMVNNDEDYNYPTSVDEGQSFAKSTIPADLLRERGGNNSIVNLLFTNLEMFLPEEMDAMKNGTMVVSPIISTQVLSGSGTKIRELSTPARFQFRTRQIDVPSDMVVDNVKCVFWDFSSEDISETTWSEDGITTMIQSTDEETKSMTVHCLSSHLTSFAVLLDVHSVLDNITSGERLALEIVTYVGLGLSIIFLLLTILILLSFGKVILQQLLYFIHLNLSIALLLANTTFIAGIDNAAANRYACVVVAGLLHYLYTAAFYWMLCEGIMLYFKVVITFSRVSKYLAEKWWFFFLIGWGIPVIPVAVSLGLIHEQYGNMRYCWIAVSDWRGGALWAFVVPFAIVIVLNTAIFVMALVRIFISRRSKLEHSESKTQRLCRLLIYNGLSILPLLGLTWVFGLLAVNQATTIFLWLFTVFNSLQGVFIFFFQIVRNPRVWKAIKKRKPGTTKSQQTRSTAAKSSTHKMSKVTSSSSVVSGQHASFTKSTSNTKFKSSTKKEALDSTGFTNPVAMDTLKEFEDLDVELFKPA